MRTYEANVTILREPMDEDFSPLCEFFNFQAETTAAAKEMLLTECRARVTRLELPGGASVLIFCVPIPEVGRVADSAELIRSRHKFSDISSIMTVTAEELFVEGYGPEVWEELSR